jgi:hypothetical protein
LGYTTTFGGSLLASIDISEQIEIWNYEGDRHQDYGVLGFDVWYRITCCLYLLGVISQRTIILKLIVV